MVGLVHVNVDDGGGVAVEGGDRVLDGERSRATARGCGGQREAVGGRGRSWEAVEGRGRPWKGERKDSP